MRPVIFGVLLALATAAFGRTIYAMVRAAGRGAADPRPRLDQLPARLVSVLVYFFGQKKVAEEGPQHLTSKHHLFIFWGFLLITIGTVELVVSGILPAFSLGLFMPGPLYTGLTSLIDVFNGVVLAMIGWALFRRIVIRPRLIPMNLDAGVILGAIGALMVTHFLYHGFHGAIALAEGAALPAGSPLSALVSRALMPIDPGSAERGASAAFWLHTGVLLTFLNYLPYSKHIHLLGALPNIFLRNLSARKMDLPKLDLEDENQWGVGRFEQFSWKSLVDTYACTECARCSNYCPAYNTGKNLSPMQLIHDIRYEMIDRDALYTERDGLRARAEGMSGHDRAELDVRLADVEQRIEAMPPMVGGRIADETLWACTTCGACQEVCPVFIEHPLKIIQMRQNLVLAQERIPAELGRTFRNIERQSNPWGISNEKRMDWADGLEVPTIEENPAPEYILWVGCAGAFDNRIIKQTRAMVKLLDAAGVSYAVLGHAEGCTGDPARRAGNEMLFQMQAEANIETLNATGVIKVVTSCPHCLHTLRNDYPQFGGNYEVVHHTQLLARLVEEGRLVPDKQVAKSVTYHDSCYLGRWNGEFEAPRAILASLDLPRGMTEPARRKQHGFCCGAGGARMFMEEDSPRVNENRTDELLATGADAIAVACPFCNIMITDGVKARDADERVTVRDVSELLADSLPDVPLSSLVRRPSA
ncbi:MAG TPA: (Fe-S)-binding protein [Kofleriaceae bacterium]|nr:(Fe-S)-binding protein [Kofleriaceae bacterium]